MTIFIIAKQRIRACTAMPAELQPDALMIRTPLDLERSGLDRNQLADLIAAQGGSPPRGRQRTRAALLHVLWQIMRQLPARDPELPAKLSPSGGRGKPHRPRLARARPRQASPRSLRPGQARPDPVSIAPSGVSKAARVLSLLRRPTGASLAELVAETGWQPHSVRGFLSATVRRKLGLTLLSTLTADAVRRYRLT